MSKIPKYLQELKELLESNKPFEHPASPGLWVKPNDVEISMKWGQALPRILKEMEALLEEVGKLRAQRAAMKEALEFYADKENHVTGESWVAPNVLISKGQTDDLGNKASEVLKAIEESE